MPDEAPDAEVPRYPVRVVAARTGLSPHVLRAWERRYQVVVPTRSEGGQRLYSGLDMKDSNGAVDQGMTDFGGNGNAVFWIGTGAPVTGYLTGGPSYAHLTYSGTTGQFSGYTIQNHWGVNYGAGIEFPLGSLSTRLDVRYREISMDGGGTFETIPITFGITF